MPSFHTPFDILFFAWVKRHVGRIADRKEDALEAQYEKRNRQKHHENPSQEGKLQVDPVDALPIKIDGELKYRRGNLIYLSK